LLLASLLHWDQFVGDQERRAGFGLDLIDGDALGVLDQGETRDGVDVEYSLHIYRQQRGLAHDKQGLKLTNSVMMSDTQFLPAVRDVR
jgi:hypothetical protein